MTVHVEQWSRDAHHPPFHPRHNAFHIELTSGYLDDHGLLLVLGCTYVRSVFL